MGLEREDPGRELKRECRQLCGGFRAPILD